MRGGGGSRMSEGQHLEWKAAWRDDHLKSVCAFANADGGKLEIGRDDDGKVVGVGSRERRRLLEEVPNKLRDLLGIVAAMAVCEDDGIPYLRIVVEPYPVAISYRGVYYQRSGSTNQILRGPALDRFLLRKTGRCWDRDAGPAGIAGRPRSNRDRGLSKAGGHGEAPNGRRTPAPIQIRVHDDRLRIFNPGSLPEGWTLEKLLGPHPSQPYNPDIANAFFWACEIETWGRGIDRVLRACKRAGTPEPEIQLEPGGLWFEVGFSDDYLESVGVRRERGEDSSPTTSERPSRDQVGTRFGTKSAPSGDSP